MKKLIVMVVMMFLISGCAERYLSGKGSEYLVYPETHVYKFSVKSIPATKEQLSNLIAKVNDIDPGASYKFEYRNRNSKHLIDNVVNEFEKLPLSAEAFSVHKNIELDKDLKITVIYHSLLQEKCKFASVEGVDVSQNCFVEAARVGQVIHKERLVEGL
ncbi:hypothetical protein AB4455_26555 [Vibrio sp. 10N.261.46.E12]|uniref:hypothetical protein n=1 Tax=unclassified Vibrio TaxID=2614977 RepID=UPI000976F45F|nr:MULTISPECIES: hypothetical protein [unclassified Vibrio]OMO37492.1 hypothetical protein BH584_22440 [Vibrio sp. 10N.261.45.E1]PMJ28152.1 hypothetical protein BCU27_05455 [Vibrio sp. 10N.286.45.B6]PML89088.1 hypothetical protein BCT66_08785 [Vibrio sp. 10N.261.49.E11]PMM71006.1 hypothetical protein BCT48_08610 [Vibrio sp. 10N.261.46.F12]PMM90053.1 hypothetical protein BCT46_03950 [Vibrio sp. 10N.261.46.E8]